MHSLFSDTVNFCNEQSHRIILAASQVRLKEPTHSKTSVRRSQLFDRNKDKSKTNWANPSSAAWSVFTAGRYASAVYTVVVCPYVCQSATSWYCAKTAKHRITQTRPHDSSGNIVFCCQRSPRHSTGVTPYGASNASGVGKNRRLSTND